MWSFEVQIIIVPPALVSIHDHLGMYQSLQIHQKFEIGATQRAYAEAEA